MIFNGKQFAAQIEAQLPKNSGKKLGIWLDKSNVYVQKKMEMAARLGVEVRLNEKIIGDEDGLMVQLPHPNAKKLIAKIPPEKDVDGLRDDSPYLPAVVVAILKILNLKFEINSLKIKNSKLKIVVVGSKGFVGKKLMQVFPDVIGIDKDDFNLEKIKNANVIISCTGQAGLIKPKMVKDGVICIDVGFPKGDFSPEVAFKAAFFTPVPGGVGPVTVVCLFENLFKWPTSLSLH